MFVTSITLIQFLSPSFQSAQDVYPLYAYGQNLPLKSAETETENNYINYLLNQPVSMDDMINQLLNQWLNNAITTGRFLYYFPTSQPMAQ